MRTDTSLGLCLAFSLLAAGCGDSEGDTDAGVDAGDVEPMDAGGEDAGGGEDGGQSDAGPVDAGPLPLTSQEFLDELTAQLCRHIVTCERRLGLVGALIGENAACHPVFRDELWGDVERALAAGTIVFDEEAARTCLDGVAAARCEDLFSGGIDADTIPCGEALVPTLAVGFNCSYDAECIDGFCALGGTCPGVCAPLRAENGLCADDDACGTGLVCNGVEGTCELRQPLDGPCAEDADCVAGLYCGSGACRDRVAEGEPCTAGNTDASPCEGALLCSGTEIRTCQFGAGLDEPCSAAVPCAQDLRCNPASGSCIETSFPGEACTIDIQCPLSNFCSAGVCVPLPVAGESCALAPSCQQGECMAGTCTLLAEGATCGGAGAPAGGECEDDLYCTGAFTTGNCAARLAEGETCRGDQCAAGLQCIGAVCSPACTPP
jgi:hypothetical protein